MYALNNKIARLEIRAEQVLLHLQLLDRRSSEAEEARRLLFAMLIRLLRYKEQRERMEDELALDQAA